MTAKTTKRFSAADLAPIDPSSISMRPSRYEFRAFEDVTIEDADDVRRGELALRMTTSRGASKYVTLRRYVTYERGEDGKTRKRIVDAKVECFDGRKWSALTTELAGLFMPEEAERRAAKAAERRAADKAGRAAAAKSVKVGDVFCSSWGYEQTNVDFYQVVEKRGQNVVLAEIAQSVTEEGFMCGHTVAVKGAFLDGSRRLGKENRGTYRINGNAEHPYVRISSYATASKWDGTPRYVSWYA